jgi:hypothetical protein
VETLSRGLINRVKIKGEPYGYAGYYVDEVVPYDSLARDYKPRKGFRLGKPGASVGKYLEKPVMHYTIGTQITKNVAKNLNDNGFDNIITHDDPPPFEPVMPRIMDMGGTDPDWKVRLNGFNLKRGFVNAASRGATSVKGDTSYVAPILEGDELYSKYKNGDSR